MLLKEISIPERLAPFMPARPRGDGGACDSSALPVIPILIILKKIPVNRIAPQGEPQQVASTRGSIAIQSKGTANRSKMVVLIKQSPKKRLLPFFPEIVERVHDADDHGNNDGKVYGIGENSRDTGKIVYLHGDLHGVRDGCGIHIVEVAYL